MNLIKKSKFAYWEESPKVAQQVEWVEGLHYQAHAAWVERLHYRVHVDLHHHNVVVIDNRNNASVFAYFHRA
jgi:Ser/Thr protein kinase RdoA (MazF antagonist)